MRIRLNIETSKHVSSRQPRSNKAREKSGEKIFHALRRLWLLLTKFIR